MKKYLLVIILFTSICAKNFAQERCLSVRHEHSGFEKWMKSKIRSFRNQRTFQKALSDTFNIPIVFHILHKGEPEGQETNLSSETIKEQVRILNEDYQRKNQDKINTPAVFSSVAGGMKLKFSLARQDPMGNPTSGIVRINTGKPTISATSDKKFIRSLSFWPPEDYLNVYVADLKSYLGLSSFPVTDLIKINNDNADSFFDAILVDYEYIGINPDSEYFKSFGRTLTHEIGHYLGLIHIWGDSKKCDLDDFVEDTPPADGSNSKLGSPCTFPNPNDKFICETPEMFQNYMDYTNDECMNLFTQGQVERMEIVIENAPRRKTLNASNGLKEIELKNLDLVVKNILQPQFFYCNSVITPKISLYNQGKETISSYKIEMFINGKLIEKKEKITSLATYQTEEILFKTIDLSKDTLNVSGKSTVGFKITQLNGEEYSLYSEIKSQNSKSNYLPFYENFESNLSVSNSFGNNKPWKIVTAPNEVTVNLAAKFDAYKNKTSFGQNTIFKTPILNVIGLKSAELKFSYAHAYDEGDFEDGLAILVSTDCGNSFKRDFVFQEMSKKLANVRNINRAFTPANKLEWKDTVINITKLLDYDKLQFAFQGLNGGGNNIFIDNIEIVQTDLEENDMNLLQISAPKITCHDNILLNCNIRNTGVQDVKMFEITYKIGSKEKKKTIKVDNLKSGDFYKHTLSVGELDLGLNEISVTINKVNETSNPDAEAETKRLRILKHVEEDTYPIRSTTFKNSSWGIYSTKSKIKWSENLLGENKVLVANGFKNEELGEETWFVSPVLKNEVLDSAGLSFKYSYAKRLNKSDKLTVLASNNCGDTFDILLFTANSDSLSDKEYTQKWIPTNKKDWKAISIDLKEKIKAKENIRIAFVFTNSGGNDLYLDDINISSAAIPTFSQMMRIHPNPAKSKFTVALNVPSKQTVTLQLIDLYGKIIEEKEIKDALNQEVSFSNLTESGIYLIRLLGKNLEETEKLIFTAD